MQLHDTLKTEEIGRRVGQINETEGEIQCENTVTSVSFEDGGRGLRAKEYKWPLESWNLLS